LPKAVDICGVPKLNFGVGGKRKSKWQMADQKPRLESGWENGIKSGYNARGWHVSAKYTRQ